MEKALPFFYSAQSFGTVRGGELANSCDMFLLPRGSKAWTMPRMEKALPTSSLSTILDRDDLNKDKIGSSLDFM
jgi:hypothetical protein